MIRNPKPIRTGTYFAKFIYSLHKGQYLPQDLYVSVRTQLKLYDMQSQSDLRIIFFRCGQFQTENLYFNKHVY